MAITLKPEAADGPPCWDLLSPQDRQRLLEAMLDIDGHAVAALEAPVGDPAAARVFWANPTFLNLTPPRAGTDLTAPRTFGMG